MADFQVSNQGSIVILTPHNKAADAWLAEHIDLDNPELQHWGTGIVVEPRYIGDIITGITGDGLEVTYA